MKSAGKCEHTYIAFQFTPIHDTNNDGLGFVMNAIAITRNKLRHCTGELQEFVLITSNCLSGGLLPTSMLNERCCWFVGQSSLQMYENKRPMN